MLTPLYVAEKMPFVPAPGPIVTVPFMQSQQLPEILRNAIIHTITNDDNKATVQLFFAAESIDHAERVEAVGFNVTRGEDYQ